jgi:hypothetical protein
MTDTNEPGAFAATMNQPRADTVRVPGHIVPGPVPSQGEAEARAEGPAPVRKSRAPIRVAPPFDPYSLPVEDVA